MENHSLLINIEGRPSLNIIYQFFSILQVIAANEPNKTGDGGFRLTISFAILLR